MNPLSITIVSDAEAEAASYVVCLRLGSPTRFRDNEVGACSHCGTAVIFRPHMPKKPPRICIECVKDLARGGRA